MNLLPRSLTASTDCSLSTIKELRRDGCGSCFKMQKTPQLAKIESRLKSYSLIHTWSSSTQESLSPSRTCRALYIRPPKRKEFRVPATTLVNSSHLGCKRKDKLMHCTRLSARKSLMDRFPKIQANSALGS
jgi:hypothetical protein